MSERVDAAYIRRAVEAADLAALRAALYQNTGDAELEKLGPVVDLSPEDQARLQDRCVQLIETGLESWKPRVPSDDEIRHIMDLVLGVPTIEEHFEIRKKMLAFEKFPFLQDPYEGMPQLPEGFSVAIIGAGPAGVAMSVQCDRLGIPYTLYERRDEIGGTWSINRYPDIRVDTLSITYEYTFEDQYPWSEYFARGAEVRSYIEQMAKRYGVVEHLRLQHDLQEARFDPEAGAWNLRFETPEGSLETSASVVVSAAGLFSNPKFPDIPGLGDFRGPVVHPTRWPDDLDLAGKRVAVVGNGSTGVQLLAPVAEEAAQVHVFQRTAQWVSPRPNYRRKIEPEVRWLLDNVPGYWNWARYTSMINLFTWHEDFLTPDPEWEAKGGHLTEKTEELKQFLIGYIHEQIGDRPDLFEKLLPDHAPMVRRPVVDNEWYKALTRDNVELVTGEVTKVTPTGLETADGEHREVDVIVFATGYDVLKYVWPAQYQGVGGVNLNEFWEQDSPRAYHGMMVPGFPNFFMLYGPNSQPVSGGISLPSWFQIWASYIAQCMLSMLERGGKSVVVTEKAFWDFNHKLDDEASGMSFTHDKNSVERNYYVNDKGRLQVNTPFETADLWTMQKAPEFDELEFG